MNSTDDIDIKEDKEKPEIIIAADSTGASIALSFLLGLDKKYLSEISKYNDPQFLEGRQP